MKAATIIFPLTRRIASATSVQRTRAQDEVRVEVHGGVNGELEERHLAAIVRLEAVADRLEKAIA